MADATATPQRSAAYSHERLQPEYRDALMRLWRENLSELSASGALEARYRWAYSENPAGRARTMLAVHGPAGEVVGCGSAYPREMLLGGDELLAATPADFAVTRTHRTASAALGIQRALVADVSSDVAFLIGFPNKSALPVMERVGYRSFAVSHSWVKPLNALYKVRPYIPSKWLARAAATPVTVYLRASDAHRLRSHAIEAGELVARADGRFDELWRRARRNYRVAGLRTSAYLNWRYADHPTLPHRFFCLGGATDLKGYVAFSTKEDKAFIGDLFALDPADTTEHLLLEFARAMRTAGFQSIFLGFAGNPHFSTRLERLGFFQRPSAVRKMVALGTRLTDPQRELVFDAKNWYLFDGEMDI